MARIDGGSPRLLLFMLCAFGVTGVASGGAGTFRIDPELTSARFAVPQLGFSKQQGRLGRTTGTIVLDPAHKVERIDLEIETASVDTGWNLRDTFLRSEVMFDAARFPQMRFRSTRLHYEGARLTGVEGEVTLRGVTRPVRFDVMHVECASRPQDDKESCGAEVSGHISRGAFGMDFAYPLIGDEVELEFAVRAFRLREADESRKMP